MGILVNNLYQALQNSFGILVYGAGMYAKVAYSILKKVGLKEKVKCFIVTDINNEIKNIDGIPICSIKNILLPDMEKYTVLIAVGDKYCSEIIRTLQDFLFDEIFLLRDFIVSEKELYQVSDEQFLDYVRESYVWEKVNSCQEFEQKNELEKQKIEQRRAEHIDDKTIVFIIGNFAPRHIKIIRALIKKKFKIIILIYGHIQSFMTNEISSCDVEISVCSTIEELLVTAMQYKPLVYVFEPVWGNCSWPQVMISHKKLFGKIVISLYDVLNDGYIQPSEEHKLMERYVLENADGIIWRWFSKEYLEEKKGFIFKGKSIQFLDYCGGNQLEENVKNDARLKLCMICGHVDPFLEICNEKNIGHIRHATIKNIMDRIGNRDDCVFHVYVGAADAEIKEICGELEKQYFNLKFIYNTQHSDLINKVSDYDYGCSIYTDGKIVSDMGIFDESYYGSMYKNAVSNKFFDYIDASIPFIATGQLALCDFFEQYKVVIRMNIVNMDIDYLKENKFFYKENAKKAKKELHIDNQIQRLIDFFQDLNN